MRKVEVMGVDGWSMFQMGQGCCSESAIAPSAAWGSTAPVMRKSRAISVRAAVGAGLDLEGCQRLAELAFEHQALQRNGRNEWLSGGAWLRTC